MSTFDFVDRVHYEGPQSHSPFCFRHYNAKRVLLGKTMEEHLRIAVCYWHTFCSPGADMFGNELFKRIDLVTRDELQAHLQTRKNALLLEIQEMQLLGELYRSAVAAGCAGDEPVFAAIDAQ